MLTSGQFTAPLSHPSLPDTHSILLVGHAIGCFLAKVMNFVTLVASTKDREVNEAFLDHNPQGHFKTNFTELN